MSELTQELARFVTATHAADLPAPVVDGARAAITDTLGVALAGAVEPAARIAARWVAELGARGQASCWGQSLASSPSEAAFANGVAAHALDFDDSHPSLRGHPSATLVPAALAVGEATHASGMEVLAAYALGLEVAGKLSRALGHGHFIRGWHTTATMGTLASAAVAARLWQLDPPALRRAWGIAASQMGGLVRNFGTMTKPFHAGNAARNGVTAAWLAREGYTADESVFDGTGGVLDTYRGGDGEAPELLAAALGQPWEIVEPGVYAKRWPCCYSNHRAVGGLFDLIARHGITARDVREIAVGFLPGGDTALVSRDPHAGLEGTFSIEYVAAAVFADGALTLDTFSDAMVQRPELRALMAKVRRYRIADDKVYSGIAGYLDIALDTTRGRFELRVDRVPGSPAWPLGEEDRTAKFMDCAARTLGPQRAERVLESCRRLHALPDIGELARALAPAAAHHQAEAVNSM
jgi:2-methylcitrate dehydratase PrpD